MSIASAPIVLSTRLGGLFVYGSGADGDVTISVNTTLTRDMQYNNLTINSGINLDPAGYRIFVKDTLTFASSTSTISRLTNTTAVGTVGGGAAVGANALNSLGGNSGDKTATQLAAGKEFYYDITRLISTLYIDATTATPSFISGGAGGSTGAAGATGAAGTANSGSAGADGTYTPNATTVAAPGGKGGTGTAGTAGTGGAGGAGGTGGPGGGVVVVLAKTIVGSGKIEIKGIAGSAGSAGAPGNAGTPGSYGSPAPSLYVPSTEATYTSPTSPVATNNTPTYTYTAGSGAYSNPNNSPTTAVANWNYTAGSGSTTNPNNSPTTAVANYTYTAGAPGTATGTWNSPNIVFPITYNSPSYTPGTFKSFNPTNYTYTAGTSTGTYNPTPKSLKYNTPKWTTTTGTVNNNTPTVSSPGNILYQPGSNNQFYNTPTNPKTAAANYNYSAGFGSFSNPNNSPTTAVANWNYIAGSGSTNNPNNSPNYTYSTGTASSWNYSAGVAATYNAVAFYPGGTGGAGGTATSGEPGAAGADGFVGGGGVLFVMSTSGIGTVTTSAAAGSSGQTGSASAGTIVIINHSVAA
jgi:hypothetical protein